MLKSASVHPFIEAVPHVVLTWCPIQCSEGLRRERCGRVSSGLIDEQFALISTSKEIVAAVLFLISFHRFIQDLYPQKLRPALYIPLPPPESL